MSKLITRRQFLRLAATTAAGTALIACQPQTVIVEKEKVVKETVEVEKIVKETVEVQVEKVVRETVVVEKLVEVTPPPPPSQFGEAPMLAEQVGAGELPAVDERVGAEPMVVEPLGEIGQYGGRLRSLTPEPASSIADDTAGNSALAEESPDGRFIMASIAKSWELADDYTELTVVMRRGMKWSDGAPMTTEDVRFWYEDILLNEELTPRINNRYTPGGELMELIIDDDYTFRWKFSVSYPLILDFLTAENPWSPKHYLKQFHITYNAQADEAAQAEGYEYWWESFQFHNNGGVTQQDADFPSLQAWIFDGEQDAQGNRYRVRNPYYYMTDTAGNQLPYIDHRDRILVESGEILVARTLAGEATHSSWFLPLADFPLLKQNEAQGNYTAMLATETRASEYGMCFNYTHKDPVLKEMFNDIRWRKAMSHALNRDEINELQFLGIGVTRQPIMDPSASFYEEGIDQYYTEHDPDLANDLLDEMGLQWDANKEWRLRPDGAPITLQLNYYTGFSGGPEISELIKGYWKVLGVDVRIKPMDRDFYQQFMQANDHDMGVWAIGGSSELYSRRNAPIRLRPPWHWPQSAPIGGTQWYNWYESKGQEGEEPPEIIQRLYDLVDQWLAEARGTERYLELGREILQINAENVWLIGTIGLVPRAVVLSNDLRNVPGEGAMVSIEHGMWRPHLPAQWWFAT